MKRLSHFSLLVILLNVACRKHNTSVQPDNPYGLPNATTEGKMIFGCRINGQNWISSNDIYHLAGSVTNDTLGVGGSPKITGYFEDMAIHIKGGLSEGVAYTLNTSTVFADFSTNKTCLGYSGSSVTWAYSVAGTVRLTRLDRTNKILSGVFDCVIPIPNCDTLHVTDGRFDLRY